ncbi:hypothetical protein SAMN05660766_0640 [Curtobacterium sp. 314Chir4.1]|uniref:contact-dependent growth inhibition system immunity protein n=1 Tax=Curtobacterium sp. 314Chir4.1 TaxID=1279028 RepID=UPI000BD826C9|nr:contact-dependent growth inhibition system immunity protein [Curtobacterium sp. 314Chir4.1]SOC86976.1 hypothetical protein SAMN05660766_0640 [Curtobacterium sp. 314Chir4.1]
MNIEQVEQIDEDTYRELLPMVGRLLEGMYLRWYVDFDSVDEIVLDLIEGYDEDDIKRMLREFDDVFAAGLAPSNAEGLLSRLDSDAPPGRNGLDGLEWLQRIRAIVASAL